MKQQPKQKYDNWVLICLTRSEVVADAVAVAVAHSDTATDTMLRGRRERGRGVWRGGQEDWLSERYSVSGRYNIWYGIAWYHRVDESTRVFMPTLTRGPGHKSLWQRLGFVSSPPSLSIPSPLPLSIPLSLVPCCALHYCIKYPALRTALSTYAMRLFQLHSAVAAQLLYVSQFDCR